MDRKKIYPIAACFVFVIICTGMIVVSILSNRQSCDSEYISSRQPEEMTSAKQETREENMISSENSVQIPVVAPVEQKRQNSGYVLEVWNGKLQVIERSTNQVYMDTEIMYEQLPEDVRKSIDTGRYFSSIEEILAFLESYSS